MKTLTVIPVFQLLIFLPVLANATDQCDVDSMAKIGRAIANSDQEKRVAHIRLSEKANKTLTQIQELQVLESQIRADDVVHQNKILDLAQRCGIPNGNLINNPFLDAALVVALHAPLEYELAIYPYLQSATKIGDLSTIALEKLERRIGYWQRMKP